MGLRLEGYLSHQRSVYLCGALGAEREDPGREIGDGRSVEYGRLWFMKATQLKGVPGKMV
jgi:hypothetical protein